MDYTHQPVLLNEAISALNIRTNGFYLDGTFGQGGHSMEIFKRLGARGRLLAFDKDPAALQTSVAVELMQHKQFNLIQGSFTMLKQFLQPDDLPLLSGVLLDLGVCSSQLENANRGFSFRFDAPLDMRMDPTQGERIADWLQCASEAKIAYVIQQYGQERAARKIAKEIIIARRTKSIMTTKQLANLVSKVIPYNVKERIHPATKTFQAFRIYINRELDELKTFLPQVTTRLQAGGRLAVISFHSLEDRIVKQFIRNQSRLPPEAKFLPIPSDQHAIKLKQVGKKIRATTIEINKNPRARSAILRVAERC